MNTLQIPIGAGDMSTAVFKYEVTPINAVYGIKKKSLYHFIVQVCAIVGGIFSMMGLLNTFTLRALDMLKSK